MHRDIALSPREREWQQTAVNLLSGYVAAAQQFQENNRPMAESPFVQATKENGGTWWRETGDLALAASFDHLGAFCTLLGGPVPRQAGFSVLRGAAEAAAVAWWVFDPDAPENDRVQRGFEERLYGIHSQRGLIEKNKTELEEQHRSVVAAAAKFGLSEVPDSQKKGLTHFGRPRPATQDVLMRVLPEKPPESKLTTGEIAWRILSAYSHSELWTNFVGMREIEDDSQPRALVVHWPTLARMCALTVTAHDRAFSRRMTLAGHPTWESSRGTLPRFRTPA